MFLLPVLVIAVSAYAAYRFLHREAPLASGGAARHVPAAAALRPPFWPTTLAGRVGIVAFALGLLPIALVNVVQVAFLQWAVQITALACTAVARFVQRDRSVSVLIVLVLTTVTVLASLLFLAGEVFVGHD